MTETYKKLYQGQPDAAAATIYTCAASTQCLAKYMVAINTTAASATLTMYDGGTTASKCILPAVTIGAGEWVERDLGVCLQTGGTLAAAVSPTDAITLTIYGLELT